jgi:hypothetical protein
MFYSGCDDVSEGLSVESWVAGVSEDLDAERMLAPVSHAPLNGTRPRASLIANAFMAFCRALPEMN